MANYHIVKQGECLSSIAKDYGFRDYTSIYGHPENADFRKLRPDPNVIYPGDRVFIPERKAKNVDRPTEKKHKFKGRASETWIRIVVKKENDKPLSGKKYELRVGDQTYPGITGEDGLLEQAVPANEVSGELKVWQEGETPASCLTWTLKIGHLDPVEMMTGIQARLNNLSFDCGPVDGIIGPRTRAAVRSFQEWHGLKVDGIPGPKTQAKLKEVHGC